MKRTNTSIRLATALLLGLMACNNSSSDPHVITSPTTGYITVDGTQLNYVVEGQGKPCLVVGSSIYYPRTFSPALRQELKMYFVDMRWFAREYEAVDLSTYNIQGIAEDIEKVRQALALEQVILIGHSIHGTMALEYAKSYPQHLSQVIAIGSPSVFGSAKFEQATQALWNTASAERKALLEDRRNLLRPTLDDLATRRTPTPKICQ
jgi:proline iminopeptidase